MFFSCLQYYILSSCQYVRIHSNFNFSNFFFHILNSNVEFGLIQILWSNLTKFDIKFGQIRPFRTNLAEFWIRNLNSTFQIKFQIISSQVRNSSELTNYSYFTIIRVYVRQTSTRQQQHRVQLFADHDEHTSTRPQLVK